METKTNLANNMLCFEDLSLKLSLYLFKNWNATKI